MMSKKKLQHNSDSSDAIKAFGHLWSLTHTPHIEDRLIASAMAHEMGFEVRWRVDPISPADNWANIYREFFFAAAKNGHRPTRITLGTYREMGSSRLTVAAKWGLPPMEWMPPKLSKNSMHYHIPMAQRIKIYRHLVSVIKSAWQTTGLIPVVALSRKPNPCETLLALIHNHCNCE